VGELPDAIVVGAGPAGLACAATMGAKGLKVAVLEKAGHVGSSWRHHYDRLHLHTDRNHSGLPGMEMPSAFSLYPSRAQVVEYLENYAARFCIQPSFGVAVTSVQRDAGQWRANASTGAFVAPIVVVATGMASAPYRPSWPGMDSYAGALLHSSDYRNPQSQAGKRVLVVGFGNSGGEIALDLAQAGVDVALAVRGPVQILPRDLLGLPILTWAILYQPLPARLVDIINAPVLRLALGSMEKLGLQRARKGPAQMVHEDGRIPLIDIGTLGLIRDGSIKLRGGIDRFTSDGVVFDNGADEAFDAVVLATGFRPDLRPFLPDVEDVIDDRGLPLVTGRTTAVGGLYFCGQITSPTGQLREIGIEARRIANLANDYLARSAVHGERQ
jgi:cation diffusion facilitator CzcD-associated flavoprotein CzcO